MVTRIGRRCKFLNCSPFHLFPTLSSHILPFPALYYPFQSYGGWVEGSTGVKTDVRTYGTVGRTYGHTDGWTDWPNSIYKIFTKEKRGGHTQGHTHGHTHGHTQGHTQGHTHGHTHGHFLNDGKIKLAVASVNYASFFLWILPCYHRIGKNTIH